jgi:hypothetical protein
LWTFSDKDKAGVARMPQMMTPLKVMRVRCDEYIKKYYSSQGGVAWGHLPAVDVGAYPTRKRRLQAPHHEETHNKNNNISANKICHKVQWIQIFMYSPLIPSQ